jgi:HEAT repeat protein
MNPNPNPFQFVLDALLNEKKKFSPKFLHHFSDMGALELKTLGDLWPRVSVKRKLSVLELLETLAEENTLVSFDDFAKSILTDAESTVRGRALRLLRESDDTRLVPTYIDMLKSDADAQTRAEAAANLGLFVALGELEEAPPDIKKQVEDELLAVAHGSDDARVRRRALEAIGFSSRPEVTALIESSFKRDDSAWQTSALFAMGRSADNRWDERVIASLANVNRNVREGAVEAAGQLGIKEATPILLKLVEDEEDDDVTGAVIWSLSQIGGEDARTFIENLLDQTDDENEDQIEFLEEALENLAFTDELDKFDLFNIETDLEFEDEAGDEEDS